MNAWAQLSAVVVDPYLGIQKKILKGQQVVFTNYHPVRYILQDKKHLNTVTDMRIKMVKIKFLVGSAQMIKVSTDVNLWYGFG